MIGPALLRLAATEGLMADSADEGLAACAARLGAPVSAIAAEVATLVAAGLLRDPVRLLPGHLHCIWCLEPTPKGRSAAG